MAERPLKRQKQAASANKEAGSGSLLSYFSRKFASKAVDKKEIIELKSDDAECIDITGSRGSGDNQVKESIGEFESQYVLQDSSHDEEEEEELDENEENAVMQCPICHMSMTGLEAYRVDIHVNECLDRSMATSAPLQSTSSGIQANSKTRAAQLPPKSGAPGGTALSAIMQGHAEDAAWKAAAKSESVRGVRAEQRQCPFYKLMPDMPFAVDAFRYGAIEGVKAYFLSHYHSDHYYGLHKTWTHGDIYGSEITLALVKQQLGVSPEYLKPLPMQGSTNIEGITVSLIDANHCPGSVLFLFEGSNHNGRRGRRILHCGDFRACPQQVIHPALKNKYIDSIYLDTTYLNPRYAFPAQSEVIKACADVCSSLAIESNIELMADKLEQTRNQAGIKGFLSKADGTTAKDSNRGRLLVVVGTYSIGKERIVKAIAKALGSKVYATAYKRRICACLNDEELNSMLVDDPALAQVHMTSLMEIRSETLAQYLDDFKGSFDRIVGFRPTGWTYRPPTGRNLDQPSISVIVNKWKTSLNALQLKPQRGSTEKAMSYGVPYSEHSSFRDLACFCMALDYGRIIPTVNVHSAKSRDKMRLLTDKWQSEKAKTGKIAFNTDADTWEPIE